MGKTKGYLKGGSVKIFGLQNDNGIALIPAYRRNGKLIRGHVRSNPGWDQPLQERYREMSKKNKKLVRYYMRDTRRALIRERKARNEGRARNNAARAMAGLGGS